MGGFCFGLAALGAAAASVDDGFVLDHRYKPGKWQTAIGLPDDWQKSLVDKSGELLYDYPGALGGFGTRIVFELSEGSGDWISQALESPKVPVVTTVHRWGDIEMVAESFAVTDSSVKSMSEIRSSGNAVEQSRIIPLSSHASSYGFASPKKGVDPELSSSAVGWGQPIRYRFSGRKGTVVFGFCEGYWDEPGQRVLELRIDGVVKKVVDPVAEVGQNKVLLVKVEAADTTGDGNIDIEVAAAPGAKDGNAILSALWVFDEVPPESEIIAGQANAKALAYAPTGLATPPKFTGPPRTDLMLVTLRNTGSSAQTIQPRIRVKSTHKLDWNEETGTVSIRNWRMVNSSHPVVEAKTEERAMVVTLPEMTLKAGETETVVVSIGSNAEGQVWSVGEARKALANARTYWNNLDLPYGVVQVPDANIQGQFDAAIRNIYQAREIKNGLPSFQVGPTQYRGLWIVDGAFLLESITHLNRPDETRAGVQHMLTYQKEDGSFEKIGAFWKENGIVLWVINRHAQLTGDDEWLESVWPVVEGIVNFYPVLRERSRQDPNALSYDFIPRGYSDGGLNVSHEYTNGYWLLVGLKSAVQMANQMGRPDLAKDWQKQYDELWGRFRTLAERDMITDEFGNRMLPIPMERPLTCKPQQGQWGFMHAAYPGLIFEQDDPILVGNLANLSANRCEGLVLGTGWDPEGLWGYAGSFFAHTQLAAGEGVEAAKTAYAFANHASPLLAWREEQRPIDHPEPHYVGDMPHNWASAEFIRLILHLIVFERDDELHLFEGLPPTWLKPGATLKIDKALTRFGEVSLTLQVADDGKTATLDVTPPTRTPASKLVVHGGAWLKEFDGKKLAKDTDVEIPTDQPSHLALTLH
ncbi:MAG: hypothetical protein DRP64_04520 [Verrucomicrobia bacterium]|nr:MAG: hypothetical protein DRP64_04520 [Verrucomicrobiota bacterium]